MDNLDAIDFDLGDGCALAQLGGLAQHAGWYSEKYAQLRRKHWTSVLAWNLAIGAVCTSAERRGYDRCAMNYVGGMT